MSDKAPKVVISQRVLHGSDTDGILQRVATVYFGALEYRVMAPSQAKGPALDWMEYLVVRNPDGLNSEVDAENAARVLVLNALESEFRRLDRDANRAQGMNPDGEHCDAQICLKGHVVHCDGTPFRPGVYCKKCGAPCIDECPECQEPIHGMSAYEIGTYSPPQFCHKCGHAYPWMEERLRTVRELLGHDKKLSVVDQDSLLKDIQYVMSDPKAELAPAKRKLIEIKLENATKFVRELVLELAAKVIVESAKP